MYRIVDAPNEMHFWMPGDDYLTNFQKGDPYIKVDEGYARLPGKGYEAIHPEVAGIDPDCNAFASSLAAMHPVDESARGFTHSNTSPWV